MLGSQKIVPIAPLLTDTDAASVVDLCTHFGRYRTYGDFGAVPFADFFSRDELQSATVLRAVCMASSYLENRGNGVFALRPLPGRSTPLPPYPSSPRPLCPPRLSLRPTRRFSCRRSLSSPNRLVL